MKSSQWEEGKRTTTWQKIKNWKTVSCFLFAYDNSNGYFQVGVFKEKDMIRLGHFKNGVSTDINHALKEAILRNSQKSQNGLTYINPSICLDLYFLEYTGDEFREPYFKELRLDLHPDQCTWEDFQIATAAFPTDVKITHPDKLLWSKEATTKIEFLSYLRDCSYYLLPFLKGSATHTHPFSPRRIW